MNVLISGLRGKQNRQWWTEHGWGFMATDRRPHPEAGQTWALDNGAYRGVKDGFKQFNRRLEEIEARVAWGTLPTPLFVVAPDLPGAGTQSLMISMLWRLRRRPALPLALAIHAGARDDLVKAAQGSFEVTFLIDRPGDTDETDAAAQNAARLKRAIHYARASTPERIARAKALGAASIDTAWPQLGPAHLKAFTDALR